MGWKLPSRICKIALAKAPLSPTDVRKPYLPLSRTSDGPLLQSVETTGVPTAIASTKTFTLVIGKALYKAKTKIDYNKLLDYCKQFDSHAVIKRLGFLLELLDISNPVIDELQALKTNSYVFLDTELPKEGKKTSRWNIKQNIDSETIQSAILT